MGMEKLKSPKNTAVYRLKRFISNGAWPLAQMILLSGVALSSSFCCLPNSPRPFSVRAT